MLLLYKDLPILAHPHMAYSPKPFKLKYEKLFIYVKSYN